MTGVGIWSALLAVSQTGSQFMFDSGRAALCHRFCLFFLWTEFLGVAKGQKLSGSGSRGIVSLQFAAECEATVKKNSTSESDRNTVVCPLRVGGGTLA